MDRYTTPEQLILMEQVAAGAARPSCPRCGGACAVIRAEPRRDVSYVRRRVVVRCSGCRRSCSAEIDAPPGGSGPGA